jgi:xanthine dehydrogenase small subunit
VAVPDGRGGWALGETLAEAREAAGKVQGRRSGKRLVWPVELPPGDWDLTLQTTWVEPAYLETDASWCEPGGEPASPLANGGAFGAKQTSIAPAAAKQLADRFGRPVRVLLSREDTVRMGPKRPPLAAGLRSDGSGSVRLVGAPGVAEAFARVAPALAVEEVSVGGLAVSASIRAAGAAEAAVLLEAARAVREGRVPSSAGGSGEASVRLPGCGRATAAVALDGRGWPARVSLLVDCGDPLDHVVVRSYCVGAAHMALGWVCSEGIAVGEDGMPEDLTIRSFGILRARETPPIEVELVGRPGPPLRCSDSAFAAVAAAAWIALGLPPRWPVYPGGKP